MARNSSSLQSARAPALARTSAPSARSASLFAGLQPTCAARKRKRVEFVGLGALTVSLLALLLVGCEHEASDAEPERVVADFIERMQRVHGDRKIARAAYDLLWADARRNLAERAKRAGDVAGRQLAPEEMLAPSRFSLRTKPRRFDARTDGDWAEVTVVGEGAGTPPVRVKCVREDGHWRVALALPNLPPIEKRPNAVE